MTDNVVQRLHASLAEALGRRRPDYDTEPVTVAEIYQELVPYRSVRTSVGFDMNADYEHALLRLLSGEGGYARLEPEEVREQLRRELATPNPDVTLFRRYAACDVWVARLPGDRSPYAPPEPDVEMVLEVESPAPSGWGEDRGAEAPRRRPWLEPDEPDEPEPVPEPPSVDEYADSGAPAVPPAEPFEEPAAEFPAVPMPDAPTFMPESVEVPEPMPTPEYARMPERAVELVPVPEPPPLAAPADSGPVACAFCRSPLPSDRPIRFCPFCGVDQQLRPCGRCGEVLEPGWRYCVVCGAAAPPVGPTA